MRIPHAGRVSVAQYEPPAGISPAVAAWLYERGKLPRAMAAAIVNMAAKGYVKIEQSEDLFTVTQISTQNSIALEPEEDVLARKLFDGFDSFDFSCPTKNCPGLRRGSHDVWNRGKNRRAGAWQHRASASVDWR